MWRKRPTRCLAPDGVPRRMRLKDAAVKPRGPGEIIPPPDKDAVVEPRGP